MEKLLDNTQAIITIDLSSILNLIQNNSFISLIGIGSVLFAIVKLIKVILKHNRENNKEAKEQRKLAYKNLKTLLQEFQNKEISVIVSKLSKKISLQDIMSISNEIHKFYSKDNGIFLANSSLFTDKIFQKIKQQNIKYRRHISPNNVPVKDIDTNIDKENLEDIRKLINDVNYEIDQLPLYVKIQLDLYLEFNKILFNELLNIQKKLAKQLGL